MKIKYFFFLAILISFTNVHANTNLLSSKFIPLKDFIILKFDLFIQSNINNLVSGGGVVAVSYQSVKYSLNIDTSFGTQFIGVISVCIFSFVLSWITFSTLKSTVGLRISRAAEKQGTDKAEVGVIAYSIRD